MKKSALLLLIILLTVLTACKPQPGETGTFINEVSDDKSDIESSLNIAKDNLIGMQYTVVEEELEFNFPLEKNDLPYVAPFHEYFMLEKESAGLLYSIVDVVLENLESQETYTEDTWVEIDTELYDREIQYRIFINNDEIILQYYCINDEDTIKGYHILIQYQEFFEYTIRSIEYDNKNDKFINAKVMNLGFEETYSEHSITFHNDNLKEWETLHRSVEGYFKIYGYEGNNELITSQIQFFSPEDNKFVTVSNKGKDIELFEITEYFNSMDRKYTISESENRFDYELNVLYVGGWDRIESFNKLYFHTPLGGYETLPDNINIIPNTTEGLFLSGYNVQNIDEEFNLANTDLYNPLNYYLYSKSKTEAIDRSQDLMEDIRINNMDYINNLYEEIFSLLYQEEFYGMAMNLD